MKWALLITGMLFSCGPKLRIGDIDSVYPIASISPVADDDSNLRALKNLVDNKRIVVLGEDAHENASGVEAHHRIIKFLTRELGFNRVLFERDMYPFWKAQQCSLRGMDGHTIATELGRRMQYYPKEWINLYEDLMKSGVTIGGFDIAYDGYFSSNITNEIRQVIGEMQEPLTAEDASYYLQFASDAELALTYTKNIYSIDQIENISRIIINDLKSRRDRVWPDIYVQVIQNNIGLLKWANSRKASRTTDMKKFYKERDVQMAKNILWWLDAFPNEKFIIHCSNYHAARNLKLSGNVRSMIDLLTDSIPAVEIFSLANITYSGSFGYVTEGVEPIQVPRRTGTSLETALHKKNFKYSLVDFTGPNRSDNRQFIVDSMAPLLEKKQRWTNAYDGMLFIDRASPFNELKISHQDHVNRMKDLVCQQ
jgi:erythromycin esterase